MLDSRDAPTPGVRRPDATRDFLRAPPPQARGTRSSSSRPQGRAARRRCVRAAATAASHARSAFARPADRSIPRVLAVAGLGLLHVATGNARADFTVLSCEPTSRPATSTHDTLAGGAPRRWAGCSTTRVSEGAEMLWRLAPVDRPILSGAHASNRTWARRSESGPLGGLEGAEA